MKIEEIKKFTFFKDFSEEEIKEFLEFSFSLKIKPGEILFKEGSYGADLYIIKKGKGEIIKKGKEKEFKIAEVEEGNIVGEIAWILGEKRSATLKAKTDMEVLRIDGDVLKKKIMEGKRGAVLFLFELLKLESKRLSLTSQEIVDILEKYIPTDEIANLKEKILKTIAF